MPTVISGALPSQSQISGWDTGTINHTAVYVGQKFENGALVHVVDQHAMGSNNFHDDSMPDNPGFNGGNASVEFVHLTYPGE